MKLIKLPPPKNKASEDVDTCKELLAEAPNNCIAIAIAAITNDGHTMYTYHYGNDYFGLIGALECLKDAIVHEHD